MKKIGITGSLASGKTSASKYLSAKRGPLFSADAVVKKLYRDKKFKSLISKKFKIDNNSNIKRTIKEKIIEDAKKIRKLEKIIHPFVRKKMKSFTSQNRNKRLLFYEVPLLVESKLTNYFNVVIFIKAKKQLRFKRFKTKSRDKKLFNLLNNKQMVDTKKVKFCDHIVVNEKNLSILKKNLSDIIKKYE